MEEVHLAYRTESFSPFVHTLREIGRDVYGLNIEVTLVRGAENAERDLVGGEIDVIIGQHYTPFVSKITGQHLTWLAIAQNRRDYKIVTRQGIRSFDELRGKSVAIANNYCLGINQQMILNGLGLEGDVTQVQVETRGGGANKALGMVERGEIAACFVDTPADIVAKRMGLLVHENTPPLDIIAGECITTIAKFIQEKDTALRALIKTYLHSVSVYTTKPDYIKNLIRNNAKIRTDLNNRFKMDDEELLNAFISRWTSRWAKKPYPKLKALANAGEKATRYDARCAEVNPLTVVDTHFVKELDESGFIDQLYK